MQSAGHSHAQSVAAALSNADRHPRRASGGIVPRYDEGGDIYPPSIDQSPSDLGPVLAPAARFARDYGAHVLEGMGDVISTPSQVVEGAKEPSVENALPLALMTLGSGAPSGGATVAMGARRPSAAQVVAPNIGRGTEAPLFDYSRLAETPQVLQYDLQRYTPARGVPQATQDLVTPERMARINEFARQGAEMGGREWYNTMPMLRAYQEELGEQAGTQAWMKYLDLVGATSPGSKVMPNVRNASYYYGLDARGEPLPDLIKTSSGNWQVPAGQIPSPYGHIYQGLQRANVGNVLEGGWGPMLFQNPKPPSFAQNLQGNYRPVTIDRHNSRLIGLTEDVPNPNQYRYLEQAQQRGAADVGLEPAQHQASTWLAGGGETGLKSTADPFIGVVEQRVRHTAQKLGLSPQDVLRRFIRGEMPLMAEGGAVELSRGIVPHYDFGGGVAQTMTGIVPSLQPGYQGGTLGPMSPYPNPMADGGDVLYGGAPISTQTAQPQQSDALQQYAALPVEKLQELQLQFHGTPQGQAISKVLAARQMQPQAGIAPQSTMARGGFAEGGAEPESFGEAASLGRHLSHGTTGFLHSAVPGRTDLIHAAPPVGAFVIPADIVSGIGQGNSNAGAFMLKNVFGAPMRGANRYGGIPRAPAAFTEPTQGPSAKRGGATGKDNPHEGMPTRILAAGGEFIVSPEGVRKIGGGDLTRGHDALDQWVVSKRREIAKTMLKLKGPKKR